MKSFFIILTIILGLWIYTAIQRNSLKSSSRTIQVTTSFYPLYFFASEIGGDKADVYNITPAGAEPHDYELTAQDITRIEKSKVLLLNGAHLEPWGDRIRSNISNKDVIVVTAGEGLATQEMEEEGKKIIDPHVWLSPSLAKREVEKIAESFIQADSTNKNFYIKNAQNLEKKLDELDEKYRNSLMNCQRKDFITSHAAFGYLAKTYGLTQVPIAGISPEEEPSLKQLTEIADFAKKQQLEYIFFESLVSPKLAETLAHEVGAQTLVLDPIEGVKQEDMTAGKNYFTIMNENLINLRIALKCK